MKYPTKVEEEFKAREAAFAVEREHGLQQIYHAYPVIPRSDANDTGIEHLCAEFHGHGTLRYPAPDLATFRAIVEADPSILTPQHGRLIIESVERQHNNVLAEIDELLTGVMSPFELKVELSKLKFQSLEQVRARRNQIRERQRLAKLSSEAIRQELKAKRDAQPERRADGFPRLPEMIVPPGKIQAVRCDSAYLLGLAKIDYWEFKRLISRYGSEQVTARMQNLD